MDGNLALLGTDDGQVDGGFRETGHGLAHADHAGRSGDDGLDGTEHGLALDELGLYGDMVLNEQPGRRVTVLELGPDGFENGQDESTYLVVLIGRNKDFTSGLERDGVAQRTAAEEDHLHTVVLHQREENPGHHLVGIGTVQGDVHAGVTALQALHGEFEALVAGGSVVFIVFEAGRYIQAAGATHAQLAFFLGVQVEEDVALEDTGLQAVGARHAGFLIVGDKHLQRAVLHGRVFQGCQAKGYADTVVGTQRGTVGRHPFPIDIGVDGIFQEIVRGIGSLLRHHVHMTLHDNALAVLHAGRGGNADDDVPCVVLDGIKAVRNAPIIQILNYFPFVLGGTGNLCEGIKVLPDHLGFQFLNLHDISVIKSYFTTGMVHSLPNW